MADPNLPQPPKPPGAPPAPQAPKPPNVFNQQRDIAQRTANQSAQQGQDAVQRRLSAMGQLNSGVGIQAQQAQQAQGAQQAQDALAGINAQEAQFDIQNRGLDFQNRSFDQTFGLDKEKFNQQMGLANREFDRDTNTTNFNQAVVAREQGFGVNLMPMLDKENMAKHYEMQGNPEAAAAVRAGDFGAAQIYQDRIGGGRNDMEAILRRYGVTRPA